ncbi:hypothetical protein CEV32_4042 [Brucella rhizosphaerae]|uniref:Uncharacterized protein n=1 Tax=Brucella rhizosphaerae TaxID=571254 RepID=A0A256FS16_9HYPH|nr:hypothetical protein CEV32_4042 [Brucella rhizosphaerae]
MQQKPYRINEDMTLLVFDLFLSIIPERVDTTPPFSAPLTLWLSMTAAVGLASRPMASPTFQVEFLVNASKRAIPIPEIEIAKQRATGRQIFRYGAPLATCRQDVHQAVDNLPQHNRPFSPTPLSRRDQRLDKGPFLIRQVTRTTHLLRS